jgi:tRNA(fMet)-specific endonuclease VapC
MRSSKRLSEVADYLLDSNVLILHLRERPEITALLTRWGVEGALCISVVTRTEILAGMHPHEEEHTMALLDSLMNLPVDGAIADRAGRLIYQYARQGIQLSLPDALIAATALHHDLALATTNPKHFPIPELHLCPLDVNDLA